MNNSTGDWIQWLIILIVLSFQIIILMKGIKEQSGKYEDILNQSKNLNDLII